MNNKFRVRCKSPVSNIGGEMTITIFDRYSGEDVYGKISLEDLNVNWNKPYNEAIIEEQNVTYNGFENIQYKIIDYLAELKE